MFNLTPYGYFPQQSGSLVKELPPGFYNVLYDQKLGGFHAKPTKALTIDHTVYGDIPKQADRIYTTFLRREDKHTAALFEGVKGSGKTLLSKAITTRFVSEQKGIVLFINEPYFGSEFVEFLQSFTGPKIVVIDEVEKTYREDEALDGLLTLLDGNVKSHTLFLLTSNETSQYSRRFTYFVNRPGRVYFKILFKGLTSEVITEYCKDNLKDLAQLSNILDLSKSFKDFNMDMLSILVEEMNLHPEESLDTLTSILNIKPDLAFSDYLLDYTCIVNGIDVTDTVDIRRWNIEEFFNGQQLDFDVTVDGEEYEWTLQHEDLVTADRKKQEYIWEDESEPNMKLTLKVNLKRSDKHYFNAF